MNMHGLGFTFCGSVKTGCQANELGEMLPMQMFALLQLLTVILILEAIFVILLFALEM